MSLQGEAVKFMKERADHRWDSIPPEYAGGVSFAIDADRWALNDVLDWLEKNIDRIRDAIVNRGTHGDPYWIDQTLEELLVVLRDG